MTEKNDNQNLEQILSSIKNMIDNKDSYPSEHTDPEQAPVRKAASTPQAAASTPQPAAATPQTAAATPIRQASNTPQPSTNTATKPSSMRPAQSSHTTPDSDSLYHSMQNKPESHINTDNQEILELVDIVPADKIDSVPIFLENPLISTDTQQKMEQNVGKLVNQFLSDKENSIAPIVKELLSPIIKDWVKNNLPKIVIQELQKEVKNVMINK